MCITEAVRVKHNELTDNNIAEYTSKWLSQAPVRVQRDEKKYVHFFSLLEVYVIIANRLIRLFEFILN